MRNLPRRRCVTTADLLGGNPQPTDRVTAGATYRPMSSSSEPRPLRVPERGQSEPQGSAGCRSGLVAGAAAQASVVRGSGQTPRAAPSIPEATLGETGERGRARQSRRLPRTCGGRTSPTNGLAVAPYCRKAAVDRAPFMP